MRRANPPAAAEQASKRRSREAAQGVINTVARGGRAG